MNDYVVFVREIFSHLSYFDKYFSLYASLKKKTLYIIGLCYAACHNILKKYLNIVYVFFYHEKS